MRLNNSNLFTGNERERERERVCVCVMKNISVEHKM